MLVVVASRHDRQARELVERWAGSGAGLLTCEDLSMQGWRYLQADPDGSVAVIGGELVAADEVTGVLTRLPYVPESELPRIAREDRAYVAAEMTAFLQCWLASLDCPVLNRPATTWISGPGWYQEQWVHVAARHGIPVRPVRRHAALAADFREDEPATPVVTATVVGGRCLGAADDTLAAHGLRLARLARADLLAVRFAETADGPQLLDADPYPDVSPPVVADAIFEYLSDGGSC